MELSCEWAWAIMSLNPNGPPKTVLSLPLLRGYSIAEGTYLKLGKVIKYSDI